MKGQCNENFEGYEFITGDFNSIDLYGSELLSPAQSVTTPQYLVIDGTVTFIEDYTFATGSDIVFLDDDSGFAVSSAFSNTPRLTLIGSTFRGCDKMWKGIDVQLFCKIKAVDCIFKDALAAIKLRRETNVELTNNDFLKNACGVLGVRATGATLLTPIFLDGLGISGNNFEGGASLLEPVNLYSIDPAIAAGTVPNSTTSYPYAGIWLQNISALTIGNSSASTNVFKDFGQVVESGIRVRAILSRESNIRVINSTFQNIGFFDPANVSNDSEGSAIYARNDELSNRQTIILSGLSDNSSTDKTFIDCYLDVYTIGSDVVMKGIESEAAAQSVWSRMSNSFQNSLYHEIQDNKIENYAGVGIAIGYFKPIEFKIEGNTIIDDENNIPIDNRFGISIRGSDPITSAEGSIIYDNRIGSSSKRFKRAFFGIEFSNVSDITIEQNHIFEVFDESSLNTFYGIRTLQLPSSDLNIINNAIRGVGTDYLFASGVYLRSTQNSNLVCNTVDDLNTGMVFLDNCDNANLLHNNFYHHDIGLALGHPLINTATFNLIGKQTNKENRWYQNSSNIEAFTSNSPSALSSVFEINSNDLNSVFWPSPRFIGNNNDNFTWFVPSLTGNEADPGLIPCFLSEPIPGDPPSGFSDTDIKLIEGTFEHPLNYPALTWEAKWNLAERLHKNPELQNLNSEVAQYFLDTYNHSYSELNRAYQKYINRWEVDQSLASTIEAITLELREAIKQRFALDNLLSENNQENHDLHQGMLALDITIVDVSNLLETKVSELNAIIDMEMNNLANEINNISCTEDYELDMKSVLQTFVASHFTDGELTETQNNEMQKIADKCRYSGGYAVVLARSFFEAQDEYEQDINCTSALLQKGDGKVILSSSDKVDIYPNPANGYFELDINQDFESGFLEIYNTSGILVGRVDLSDGRTMINTNELPSGVYSLAISLDKQASIHRVLVIAK